jgi:hypothetical protein
MISGGGNKKYMPKENTHLWFAHEVLHHCPDPRLLRDVSENVRSYYLGSFIPDTFFYASGNSLTDISEILHGKNNTPTNEAVISVLDHARSIRDIAFILGYTTHCALDIVFHPVVNALAGNYYDNDPVQRSRSVYQHRHIETCLDDRIGNRLRIHRLTRPGLVRGLAYEDFICRRFAAPRHSLRRTLSRQLMFNRMFTSPAAYAAVRSLYRLGILPSREILPLFYPNQRHDTSCIQNPIVYFDTKTGAERQVHLEALFTRARSKALTMMLAAYGFFRGTDSRKHLLEAIPGENLSTGEVPYPLQ